MYFLLFSKTALIVGVTVFTSPTLSYSKASFCVFICCFSLVSNMCVRLKTTPILRFLDAESLKTVDGPSGNSLLQTKRTAQPLNHIFTGGHTSNPLRKPIFKAKTSSNSDQPVETSNNLESISNRQRSPPQEMTDASCPKQETSNGSSEIKEEPSTVTSPPGCESEAPSADISDENEEDEDVTVFFTPELFEDESNDGSPHEEINAKSPTKGENLVLLSEELVQEPGQTPASNGQIAVSVREEGSELSQGQEEKEKEEKDSQKSQPHSWFRKLSSSKQTASSSPTGN